MKAFQKLVDASRKEPDAAHPRVRVAILDTGLDLSHKDISKAQEQGRLKFKDFVQVSDEIKDEDGHGTHCTSLVLKHAPNAEVFSGRVFRTSKADKDSCSILTKVKPVSYLCKRFSTNICRPFATPQRCGKSISFQYLLDLHEMTTRIQSYCRKKSEKPAGIS